MKSLMKWSSRHPILVVCVMVAATVVMGSGIPKVRVDGSGSGLMIKGDPAIEFYHQTLEKFGSDNVAVIFFQDDDLFTPEKIALMDELHFRFEELENVERVESIFSETHFKGENGLLTTAPLVDFLPETIEEAEQIKADALSSPLLVNNIIAKDGMSAAINLYVDTASDDPDFDKKFTQKIEAVLEQVRPEFNRIFQLGTIYTQTSVATGIINDQALMVPISAMVLLFILTVFMRSAAGALLPVLTAGSCMIWTAGFMGYMGVPLNILTVIVPSLIIVIGSTEDIHLLAEYMKGMDTHGSNRLKAVDYMAAKTGTAVLLTALTTFLGFLSINLNDITMLKHFGMTASFGLFTNPLITCLVAPVFLRWMGPSPRPGQKNLPNANDKLMHFLGDKILHLIHNYKWLVFTTLMTGALVVTLFSITVKVDNDLLSFFKSDSDIRVRSRVLHEQISGAQVFYIRVTSGVPGYFKEPSNLKAVSALMAHMEQTKAFDKITGFTDYLKLINREMNDGKPEFYKLPHTRQLVAQYLLTLQRDDIRQFVTSDFSEVNIIVRHHIGSSYELNRVVDQIETYINTRMNEHLKVRFTGENILINSATDSIAKGQIQSLMLMMFIIFVVMSLLFVNIKAGFLSLVPNLFPVVMMFGIMGIFKIPLNAGTAMVAVVAVGVAVDDTIHFMTRYNKEMRELQDSKKAIEACIRAEITPVFSTSVALASGFAVICLANFMPLIYFGFLAAFVIILALVADMFITPILLSSTQLITVWDMLKLQLQTNVLQCSPLFDNLSHSQRKRVVLLGKVFDRPKGSTALSNGAYGDSMFLLLEGSVDVIAHGESGSKKNINTILPGDVFGEIAMLLPGPRTADVIATQDIKYLEISWQGIQRIQKIYPRIAAHLYRNISRILSERLKKSTLAVMEYHK